MPQTFFVNAPRGMASVKYKGKPASRKRFRAAGFSRNAPKRKRTKRATPRQLAARKKFAAMARARAAGARKVSRAQSLTGGSMARRKRKAGARRRSTTRKRRSVSARRRRSYATNPRRVRRRRSVAKRGRIRRYRRNPGMGSMLGGVKESFIGAGAVLGGMAAGRFVSSMIPLNASNAAQQPLYDFAKGVLVSIGVRMLGRKVIGRKYADLAAIGVLVGPSRNLILSYVPGASPFLGNGVMAMPRFTSGGRLPSGTAAYPGGVAAYSDGLSAYSESYPGN